MTKYGTLIDNTLHPAPRAVRIGGAVVCNVRDLDMFEMQRRGMTRWRAQ